MKKTNHYKGHRWTNEELLLLMKLWDGDESLKSIAEKLDSSEYAIAKQVVRMRQQGIKIRKRKSGNKAGRHAQKWTQGEVEYLVRRREEKATNDEISSELGRSWNAIQAMIYKLRHEEKINIPMRGHGVSRLWNAEELRAMYLNKDCENESNKN